MFCFWKKIYMKIQCLGGFQEVGRNAILLQGRENLLLDYGIKVEKEEIPLRTKERIDGLLLSHPHLDHCGMVPTIRSHTYATAATLDQALLLLKDSIKVAKLKGCNPQFSLRDIEKMQVSRITFGQQFDVGSSVIDVFDSGHVPGSAGFLIETGGKRIFYTGDYRLSATRLLNGARYDLNGIDVLLTESTYSYKEHPPREQSEKELVEIINNTIAQDGNVLVPTFAVGRAAELLMILDAHKIRHPVYLDGMAKEAVDITLRYPELLRDPKALKKAVEDVVPLYSQTDRKMALKRPSVIITTAGMLSGGPVVHFLEKLHNAPNCSLVFTGFQVPDTPGRILLDTGKFINEEGDKKFDVKMKIHYLDFSAHASRSELLELIKRTNAEKTILLHGDRCEEFAEELQQQGLDAIAPENSDIVEI